VELAREAGLYLVQAVGWRRVERVVGLPAFDLGDRRLNAGTDEPHDPVGIAVGLGRMGPLVKIGVADEHDLVRGDAGDLVRAGRRQRMRADVVQGCCRGYRE